MSIKKIALLLLAFCICFGLAACGGGEAPSTIKPENSTSSSGNSATTQTPDSVQTEKPSAALGGITYMPGEELSSFMDVLTDASDKFDEIDFVPDDGNMDNITKDLNIQLARAKGVQGIFYLAAEAVIDGKTYQGVPVTRTENGDEIKWVVEGEQDSEIYGGLHKTIETIVLNTKTNTLTIECKKVSPEGEPLLREVYEAVVLESGDIIAQYYSWADSESTGGLLSEAMQFRWNGETGTYQAMVGKLKNETIDFSYPSIVGKRDLDRDAYSNIADPTFTAKVESSKGEYIEP